jgi:hypothetical protein
VHRSLAFDEGRKVKEAFAAIGKAPAPGFLFLFDKTGTLVWKEVFASAQINLSRRVHC